MELWRVDGSGYRVRTASANGGPRSGREGGNELICTVAEVFMAKEARKERARLIAAAPELLAACAWFDNRAFKGMSDETAATTAREFLDVARAAIAKAIGGPHA